MTLVILECDLRRLFRDGKRFPPGSVWLSEPGVGSDYGLPDVWVLCDFGFIPLELKRGEDPLRRFEPSQKKFHKLSLLRGCHTFCMSIVSEELAIGFRMELLRGELKAYPEEEFSLFGPSDKFLECSRLVTWIKKSVKRHKKH